MQIINATNTTLDYNIISKLASICEKPDKINTYMVSSLKKKSDIKFENDGCNENSKDLELVITMKVSMNEAKMYLPEKTMVDLKKKSRNKVKPSRLYRKKRIDETEKKQRPICVNEIGVNTELPNFPNYICHLGYQKWIELSNTAPKILNISKKLYTNMVEHNSIICVYKENGELDVEESRAASIDHYYDIIIEKAYRKEIKTLNTNIHNALLLIDSYKKTDNEYTKDENIKYLVIYKDFTTRKYASFDSLDKDVLYAIIEHTEQSKDFIDLILKNAAKIRSIYCSYQLQKRKKQYVSHKKPLSNLFKTVKLIDNPVKQDVFIPVDPLDIFRNALSTNYPNN